MQRACHQCGHDIGAAERIGRRDTCLHCDADLHCCLNCTFFETHSENQCRESQAERQLEKADGNFCDYFSFRPGSRDAKVDSAAATRAKLATLFERKKG